MVTMRKTKPKTIPNIPPPKMSLSFKRSFNISQRFPEKNNSIPMNLSKNQLLYDIKRNFQETVENKYVKKIIQSLGSVLFGANMPSWTWSGELQILG